MRVVLAQSAGFCYGVRRAVELAERTAGEGRPCWMLGPVIHNRDEVERLEALGKSPEELRKEMLPQAEELARIQVLLLSIAKKEGLEVSDQEVAAQIYQDSMRSGEDFKSLRESYERSGLIFVLRDRLLADKAMDRVYAKARVTEVEPGASRSDGEAVAPAQAPATPGEESK